MVISSIEPERFVFVDECSSNTSLAPLYGWARKGERAHQKAPRNWGKNITLISSIGKEWGGFGLTPDERTVFAYATAASFSITSSYSAGLR